MDFGKIEKKWKKIWEKERIYKTVGWRNGKPKKFYVLDMFPYPSGEGLHVGHPRGYIATDVSARYKMMKGYRVLHPMGWDAFGLPAENYALKHKIHPKIAVSKNIKRFKEQLSKFGFTYDWDKEINTTDPEYYKWTQWIFLKMFENGLVYESHEPIIWCPSCRTSLALEDLENGECERCGSKVERKPLRQWVLKMTAYAEKLLSGLKSLDWPEPIKEQQRNWIGRSEGATIKFKIETKKKPKFSFKFRPHLVPLVLSGEKYISYRLIPKNIKVGDLVDFINFKTKEKYTLARITKVEKKKAKQLLHVEPGHEKFKTRKEFYDTYAGYYNMEVNDNTNIWLYYFELIPEEIEVFTTRLDTIFGCTYLVAAPEHPLIKNYELRIKNYGEVKKYINQAGKKTDLMRTDLAKEKTGIELKGIKAINLFNKKEVPIFVADYVLGGYGTGAVMAVPAHDKRDWEFAKKYKLPIKMVICPNYPEPKCPVLESAYVDDGHLVNSGEFSGLTSEQAREKMAAWLIKNNFGNKKINYKMRDWVFARQRYWGEPFPLVYCEACAEKIKRGKYKKGEFTKGEFMNPGWVQIPENNLPVKLPNVKSYEPSGTGESPLVNIKEWVNARCPKCKGAGKRETNTMPQWAGSNWYYIAYLIKKGKKYKWDKKEIKKWLPVDLYVGGVEHATRHLLYARFWHKFLYDIKEVSTPEPFKKLMNQGLILAEDGRKMSKRWKNVVNPDDIIKVFGADAIRLYEMFMGPFGQSIAWSTDGIKGVSRFLDRVWKLSQKLDNKSQEENKKLDGLINKTIKKVTEDIEDFRFNTAISALMILANEMEKYPQLPITNYQLLIKLLSPFAPFLTEEIWRGVLGKKKSIHLEKWPKYDTKLIVENKFKLIIQINGKFRDLIEAEKGINEEEAKKSALNSEKIKTLIGDREIKRVIYVKDRLINIVL